MIVTCSRKACNTIENIDLVKNAPMGAEPTWMFVTLASGGSYSYCCAYCAVTDLEEQFRPSKGLI